MKPDGRALGQISSNQMLINFHLMFLLVFSSFYEIRSQTLEENNYRFEHVGLREGLSQSSVLSIHQDHFGFLWLGTRDGLNKYNGYGFEVFRHDVEDSLSLGGNIINEIAEDRNGNIWLVHENGLSRFNRSTQNFDNYFLQESGESGIFFNTLFIDRNGGVWLGGRKGLYFFDPQKKNFSQHIFSKYDGGQLSMVSSFAEGKDGKIYLGTSRFGLYALDLDRKEIEVFESQKDGLEQLSRIESIVPLDDGKFWLGTYGSGLFLLDENKTIVNRYSSFELGPHKKIQNDNIRCMVLDEENRLWVGTFDGLFIIGEDQTQTALYHQDGDLMSLSHNSIRSLLVDRKGSVWIGTYYGGLNVYDSQTQRFKHFYHRINQPSSLSYNVVGAFDFSSEHLLVGTERGGLNVKGFSNDSFQVLGDQQATVKAIHHEDGSAWVGVFRNGLQKIDLKSGRGKSFPTPSDKEYKFLHNSIINSIVADDDPNLLWIGTDSDGGLHLFDKTLEQFVPYPGMEKLKVFLGNFPVKHISIDGNNLVLSTKGKGVVWFNRNSGEFYHKITFELGNRQIFIDEFNHSFKDTDGNTWLSSNGEGVFVLNGSGSTFKRFHTGDGLVNNIVWGTMEAKDGKIWIICLTGLSRFEFDSGFRNFTYNSGFPLEEINEAAFVQDKNGEFYIGGNNGFSSFNPVSLEQNRFIPPLVLTDLRISNKRILPNDETGILKDELNKTSSIVIKYSQSVLTIDYAALNYIRPENNQYAYMLENFDKDWVYAGNRRSVTYTNLPEGTYTFLVKGSNNDAFWNEDPIRLEIIVLPPPWRTWWAILLYVIFTVVGFFVIRQNAVKSTQLKNNLRFEQLEKQKWKEVHDLKLKYFIDVSHEFRTPLTLILTPLEELIAKSNQDSWLRSRLKVMYFNAKRLLLLIDQIMEIRELETGHHKIEKQPYYLNALLFEIIDSFKALADKKKIKLVFVSSKVVEQPVMVDRDKIEKILFNLISNAFKFTPAGGEIKLEVKQKGYQFEFSVSDTGTGMDKETVERVFDRFFKKGKNNFGAGIGLSLTKALVEVLGGRITLQSKEGKGSCFSFFIPVELSDGENTISEVQGGFVKPLPLEYQESTAELEEEINLDEDKKPGLLIIEDNKDLRKYLKDQLKSSYKIKVAKDGESGLRKASNSSIALVISDVMMPGIDGFEVCRIIKSSPELCHIPVILLTAKSSQNHKLEGLEFGADDYLTKPFNLLELKVRIKNIIENRKRLHDKYKDNTFIPDSSEVAFNSFDEKLLKKVNKFLLDNLDVPNLTVESISSEVGLSRVHLFRKLKALTGLSPSDYIKDFRIKNACRLLMDGNMKISEVAYSVGFQDVHYFGKVFKKELGISPSLYKNNSVKQIDGE
jgi:signal transduction histidine kinase/AraC-like DNA-binding protein/streptogramin lyase